MFYGSSSSSSRFQIQILDDVKIQITFGFGWLRWKIASSTIQLQSWFLSSAGHVMQFCDDFSSFDHWAVRAFDCAPGKKIVEMAQDNAKKRQANAKLLASICDATREPLDFCI